MGLLENMGLATAIVLGAWIFTLPLKSHMGVEWAIVALVFINTLVTTTYYA